MRVDAVEIGAVAHPGEEIGQHQIGEGRDRPLTVILAAPAADRALDDDALGGIAQMKKTMGIRHDASRSAPRSGPRADHCRVRLPPELMGNKRKKKMHL